MRLPRLPWRRRARPAAPPPEPAPPDGRGPVPREVLRQVRLIEMRTRGLVNALFSGEYHSVFKGQGMEFAEVRDYQPGDDVRAIDWNVTARMGEPYVKKHVEERELTVLLLVDLSGSEQFGTHARFKAELAAEIGAVLALSAVRNNDRIGLLIFTDRIEHYVPPKKGRRHVLRLIRDVLAFRPAGRGTDLGGALDFAARVLRHRGILFVLSDFHVPGELMDEAGDEAAAGSAETSEHPFRRTLRLVSRRHDVVAIRITDPREEILPAAGLLHLRDPETGEEVWVDAGSPATRMRFQERMEAEAASLRRLFRRLRVDEVEVRTDQPYVGPLLDFFRRRERKLAR